MFDNLRSKFKDKHEFHTKVQKFVKLLFYQ